MHGDINGSVESVGQGRAYLDSHDWPFTSPRYLIGCHKVPAKAVRVFSNANRVEQSMLVTGNPAGPASDRSSCPGPLASPVMDGTVAPSQSTADRRGKISREIQGGVL